MSKVWFPYSKMDQIPRPKKVVSAEGAYLQLEDGTHLLDGISSWWCVIHGYNHPELNAAIEEQLSKMAHVMLCGLTHDPAEKLSAKLIEISPKGLNHVFFTDSGSVGMEVAMKMAIQYWRNKGQTQKTAFVALNKAYHGDTIGVMSIGDPHDGMHAIFQDAIQQNHFVDAGDIQALETCLKENHNTIAAMVVEPLMQGAGGFCLHSPDYLKHAKSLCETYNVLFICDEIATGFGRTGSLFACDQAQISPDIMVLSKALTGGYMGLAATLASTDIYQSFIDANTAFMHGPTFMGNPLACAVALKSIELFEKENYLEKIAKISTLFEEQLGQLTHPKIKEVRIKGAMAVVEVHDDKDLDGFQAYAIEQGVWLRPFDRFCYTMPPYIVTDLEVLKICDVIKLWFS